jgi:hypothetical protein
VSGLDREGDQAGHPCIGFCIAGRLTRLHSDWAVIAAAGAFSIGVPPPRTSNPVRLKRNEHMADLLLATPALAQKVWRSMASPSTRRVARKLSQSGLPISHETVNRWRRDGWRVVERPQHPLDAARASLDDAVPVLTGDPTTTIEDLLRNSPDREQLEELSDAELLRKAAREVLIAVCLAARALMLKPTLVLTKPAEVGVLMRALAECYRAATVAFGHARNMPGQPGASADA